MAGLLIAVASMVVLSVLNQVVPPLLAVLPIAVRLPAALVVAQELF